MPPVLPDVTGWWWTALSQTCCAPFLMSQLESIPLNLPVMWVRTLVFDMEQNRHGAQVLLVLMGALALLLPLLAWTCQTACKVGMLTAPVPVRMGILGTALRT